MKKIITGILAAGFLTLAGVTGVFAAVPGHGARFIDADGNGICDHYEAGYGCGNGAGCGFGTGQSADCPGAAACGSGCGHGSRLRLQDGTGSGCMSRGGCRR